MILTEWAATGGLSLSDEQIRVLRSRFRADVAVDLDAHSGPDAARRWIVRPTSIVGAIRTADGPLVVRPKTPVGNVLFLLGLGWGREPLDALEDALLASVDDLTTALAGFYARLAERTLSHGILRGYRRVEEDRQTVRGRIDIAEQLRRRPGRLLPVAVRYDEHDEDVVENQLVLAAALALLRLPLPVDVRRRLHRVTATLDGVHPVRFTAPLPTVHWTPLNEPYRHVVELARIVLHGTSLDLDAGDLDAFGLTLDMNAVFERFVGAAVGGALTAIGGRVAEQDGTWWLDCGQQVRLRPDLIWYGADALPRTAVDAKYKVAGGAGVPESDVYQMLAYCVGLSVPHGHLIYADAGGADVLNIAHGGPIIHTHTLRLSVPPAQLLDAARSIAQKIHHHQSWVPRSSDADTSQYGTRTG